jgi:hypothetical protein
VTRKLKKFHTGPTVERSTACLARGKRKDWRVHDAVAVAILPTVSTVPTELFTMSKSGRTSSSPRPRQGCRPLHRPPRQWALFFQLYGAPAWSYYAPRGCTASYSTAHTLPCCMHISYSTNLSLICGGPCGQELLAILVQLSCAVAQTLPSMQFSKSHIRPRVIIARIPTIPCPPPAVSLIFPSFSSSLGASRRLPEPCGTSIYPRRQKPRHAGPRGGKKRTCASVQ